MEQDPVKLLQEATQTIADMKANNAVVIEALKKSTEASSADAKEAIKLANDLSGKLMAQGNQLKEVEQKFAEKVIEGKAKVQSLGALMVHSEEFKAMASGAAKSAKITQIQANTITGQGGSPAENTDTLVAPDRLGGIVGGAFRNLRVTDILPAIPVSSNAFEYTRELLFTNNAAERSEGTQKPESVLTFEKVTANIRTIATFLKASKQILEDAPALAAYIDTRLRYAADLRMEQQIVNGNGTNPNISGMLDSGNYTAFTPTPGENALDSLNRMQAAVAAADYEATAYLMNPADWFAIERIKRGSGDASYVVGNPVGILGRFLWSLPVVVSNSVPAGTALCANFEIAYQLLMRQGTVVEMFEQDGDNVQKNLVTIRSEKRGALATYRPASSVAGLLVDVGT